MEEKKTMRQIQEEFFEIILETEDMEEILESYDLSPLEVLMILYDSGYIKDTYTNDNYELDFEYD